MNSSLISSILIESPLSIASSSFIVRSSVVFKSPALTEDIDIMNSIKITEINMNLLLFITINPKIF